MKLQRLTTQEGYEWYRIKAITTCKNLTLNGNGLRNIGVMIDHGIPNQEIHDDVPVILSK